ncbi:hypothetical protein J6590_012991 [Homalodisca vitripennis]|nr:hypothetical protein J6590_012991 [Homalodisca vitripennis]
MKARGYQADTSPRGFTLNFPVEAINTPARSHSQSDRGNQGEMTITQSGAGGDVPVCTARDKRRDVDAVITPAHEVTEALSDTTAAAAAATDARRCRTE